MQKTGYKDVDMVELGRMIRAVREASNLSADELAAAAGSITRPSLTRFECGKSGAPSFNTLYRILIAVGELPIIKNADFDFKPYSKETVDLLHYFIKEDNESIWPNYSQSVSKQIAESCDQWSKHELDTLLFFVQCKNGRDDVMPQADKLNKALISHEITAADINREDAARYIVDNTDYVLRLKQFAFSLEQESRYPEIFKLIGEIIEKVCNHVELMPTGKQ